MFSDDAGKLGDHAWYSSNSQSKTHQVGQKSPNAWGLYDLLGNVWEWCGDSYDEKYYASSPAADPPGASGASSRVFRGGSWNFGMVQERPFSGNTWDLSADPHRSRVAAGLRESLAAVLGLQFRENRVYPRSSSQ